MGSLARQDNSTFKVSVRILKCVACLSVLDFALIFQKQYCNDVGNKNTIESFKLIMLAGVTKGVYFLTKISKIVLRSFEAVLSPFKQFYHRTNNGSD